MMNFLIPSALILITILLISGKSSKPKKSTKPKPIADTLRELYESEESPHLKEMLFKAWQKNQTNKHLVSEN